MCSCVYAMAAKPRAAAVKTPLCSFSSVELGARWPSQRQASMRARKPKTSQQRRCEAAFQWPRKPLMRAYLESVRC